MKALVRENRELRKRLANLVVTVRKGLYLLDEEMRNPPNVGRGIRIAQIANAMGMANDQARFFALGIDYRKDTPYVPGTHEDDLRLAAKLAKRPKRKG